MRRARGPTAVDTINDLDLGAAVDLHVSRDAQHVVAQDPTQPDRFHVTAHDGTAVGVVYRTRGGYRCWTLHDPGEPVVVRNLARAVAHYRTEP